MPALLASLLVVAGCDATTTGEEGPTGEGEGGSAWLSGTVDERFQDVGDQLGGFSQTMLEVGHRYSELHWAIEDENWEYASYQVEKIGDAVARGIVRRPGRAESAESLFLNGPVEQMLEALGDGRPEAVQDEFSEFTAACNNCHVREEMEFVWIGPPAERTTPVQSPDPNR